jgi:hypothetical protein
MAQTTTSENACNAVIALDNDAGTLVDISGSTNAVSLNFTIQMGESYTFDGDFPIRKTCAKDCTGTLTVLYTTAGDEGWDLIKGWYHVYDGAARTMRIDMPSTGGGNDRYEGEVILTAYSHDFSAEEPATVMVEAEIAASGEMLLLEIGT